MAVRRDTVVQHTETYVYAPLNDVADQIRICRIMPGPERSALSITLRNVRLSDSVGQYLCLSYPWGDTSARNEISLNDSCHEITPNLRTLLRRLRAFGVEGDLWIDALCIDQKNNSEKIEQIKLMPRIFSGAKEVLIGLEEKIQSVRRPVGDHARVKATIEGLANGSHLYELDCFVNAGAKGATGKANDQFRQLLMSPWFTRAWVVQEICLARGASLLCSWGTMPWTTLVQAFKNWHDHRKNPDCCSSFTESLDDSVTTACYKVYCHIESIAFITDHLRKGQHLMQSMLLFQHLDVTEEKDKYYAFRGLHTAGGNLPPPDHTKSTKEVFTELAVWMLRDTRSLMPLAMDLHGGPELPTWVPNFAMTLPLEANYFRSRLTFFQKYDCAKGLDWSVEHVSPGKLRMLGMEVDTIQDVSKDAFTFTDTTEHAEFLRQWYNFAGGGINSLTSSLLFDDIFSTTMIAGCAEDDIDIHEATAVELADWKNLLTRFLQDAFVDNKAIPPRLMACHVTAVLNRRLFRTCAGRLGVGPEALTPGDSIFIFGGGNAPFVLRRSTSGNSDEQEHVLIGHVYVHGIMHGQAVQQKSELQQRLLI